MSVNDKMSEFGSITDGEKWLYCLTILKSQARWDGPETNLYWKDIRVIVICPVAEMQSFDLYKIKVISTKNKTIKA